MMIIIFWEMIIIIDKCNITFKLKKNLKIF
jgi:hypothetical protein